MRAFFELLFPPQCAVCGAIGRGVCADCEPPDRPRVHCTLPTLTVIALGSYRDALRRAVLAVKEGRRDVAAELGNRLAALITPGTLLVPVTTTVARRRARGFDGVVTMTQIAAAASGAAVLAALKRSTGDAQRGRSRSDRLAARGRFLCDATLVSGQRVTLLDDVCTTGTTLEDCAATLRTAGATVNDALVVAVA